MSEIIETKEERREKIIEGVQGLREKVVEFATKIHPLYVSLNWCWKDRTGSKSVGEVPSESRITLGLLKLLDGFESRAKAGELDDVREWRVSTSGLEAGFCGPEFWLHFGIDTREYITGLEEMWDITMPEEQPNDQEA